MQQQGVFTQAIWFLKRWRRVIDMGECMGFPGTAPQITIHKNTPSSK